MKLQKSVTIAFLAVILFLGSLPTSNGQATFVKAKFGSYGFGSNQFYFPSSVEIIDDKIYVSDAFRVQIFDMNYNYLDEFDGSDSGSSFSSAVDIESNGTHLFISDFGNDQVKVFDLNGNFIGATSPGVAGLVTGIEIYKNELYVSSFTNNSIVVFNATTLQYEREILHGGWGYLESPRGIDIYNDIVYVSTGSNGTVKMFTTTGSFIGYFGEDGVDKASSLRFPTGLVIDDKKVFVADAANDRIMVFDLNGNVLDVIYAGLNAPRHFDFTRTSLLVAEESDHEVTVLRLVANPTGVTARAVDADVQLSWDIDASMGISDPERYKIYRNDGSGYEYIGSTPNEYFIDSTAAQNSTYVYRVKAVSGIGESNFVSSNTVSVGADQPQLVTITETDTSSGDEGESFIDSVSSPIYSVVGMLLLVPIIRKRIFRG